MPLGRLDHEHRFTTRDLIACEQAIVEGAERRVGERAALLHPRLSDLVLADLPGGLSDEQLEAARTLATDGRGISVLQALAGTGKTRVLGAMAQIYQAAGCHVIGVAPTGRAARELADAAGIAGFTIHRLLSELEGAGGFAPRTVVLFDEAGSAPTRPSAALFERTERAGAKVIAAGDAGQLPSVAAGGWFAALADRLGGPELRQVLRQRDAAEREALEELHDGQPDQYLELKLKQGALAIHEHEAEAIDTIVTDWNTARQAHGLAQAVMIARDNATRELLNDRAHELLVRDSTLAPKGVTIADQEFRVGDRVIARRNDGFRDIDNGTLAQVLDIDHRIGALTMLTDNGQRRLLDVPYVAEHLEHAYALTGHGAHGATVEWAGVIGRPSEFTREWAYTALSRARGRTRVYVTAEPTAGQREREQYAQPEPQRSAEEALEVRARSMRRREAEPLATEQAAPLAVPTVSPSELSRTLLAELQEAGADRAANPFVAPPEPNWRGLRRTRERGHERGFGREF